MKSIGYAGFIVIGRPDHLEAHPSYFTYINQVQGDDARGAIVSQLDHALSLVGTISEEKSLHRYAPGKWSMREVLSHVTDTERVFAYRLLWIARGFAEPLPSFDQEEGTRGAQADRLSWQTLTEDFRCVRLATISLFDTLPEEAWTRRGMASGKLFTVRALAFIVPGHTAHHLEILRSRYLEAMQ